MNGAETLLQVAKETGVEVCFTNPGTTELPLVAAAKDSLRAVLCLTEGVAAGAADGYGRIQKCPAMTWLHLGVGLSNAMANLHNARRAHTPLINIVGDYPAHHLRDRPPLAMDVNALVAAASDWWRRSESTASIGSDFVDARLAAGSVPGSIATLILSSEVLLANSEFERRPRLADSPPEKISAQAIDEALEFLRAPQSALLLGGTALRGEALLAADQIAAKLNCRLLVEAFPACLEGGAGFPSLERIPAMADFAAGFFANIRQVVLVGLNPPVANFADPQDSISVLPEGLPHLQLAGPVQNAGAVLLEMCDRLGASQTPVKRGMARKVSVRSARLSAREVLQTLIAEQPEDLIFIDEGISSGGVYLGLTTEVQHYTYLSLTGGATGFSLASAIGAAIAAPDRKIVAYVGDGSALFSPQALWTQAHEKLNILNLVVVNHSYRILQLEMARKYPEGRFGEALTSIHSPTIDWRKLGEAFGVDSAWTHDRETFRRQLARMMREPGPHLLAVEEEVVNG